VKRAAALVAFLIVARLPAAADEPPAYRTTLLGIGTTTITVEGGATLARASTLDVGSAAHALGTTVYLRLDERGAVESISRSRPRHAQAETLADVPAADFLIAARSAAQQSAERLTITILVAVPPRTPNGEDVYLSTDRTQFAAAELRMNRIDPLHWSIDVPIARGSTLVYRFTRGSAATGERDAAGGGVAAHTVLADTAKATRDTVASWADVP